MVCIKRAPGSLSLYEARPGHAFSACQPVPNYFYPSDIVLVYPHSSMRNGNATIPRSNIEPHPGHGICKSTATNQYDKAFHVLIRQVKEPETILQIITKNKLWHTHVNNSILSTSSSQHNCHSCPLPGHSWGRPQLLLLHPSQSTKTED